MSTEALLALLKDVRQVGPGRWVARCPAHEDRTPSLSIREAEDGRILMHCFAGCRTSDVLQALGLTFRDLFPKGAPQTPGAFQKAVRQKVEHIVDEAAEVLHFFELAKRNLGPLLFEQPWAMLLHREALLEHLWDVCRCGHLENLRELQREVETWKALIF